MRIGELAQATGVDIETIRYYEKISLLASPTRAVNGYRDYAPSHLERLAFVKHCRALDMPLAEIKRLLDFVAKPTADCGDVDHLIDEHLLRVRARLNSLKALEQQLVMLRKRCTEPHTTGECGILQELVAAAHGEACACHQAVPRDESNLFTVKRPG